MITPNHNKIIWFSVTLLSLLFPIVSSAQTTLSPDLLVRGLERGLYGEDVQELQKFLNASGFLVSSEGPGSPGEETTFFGDLTLEALTRFQEANPETYQSVGLEEPSGYFGPATRSKVVEVAETIPDVEIVSPPPQVLEKVFSYRPFVGREVVPESTIFEPFREVARNIQETSLTTTTTQTQTPTITTTQTITTQPVTTTQTFTITSRPASNPPPSSSGSSSPAPIVYATDLTNLVISGSPSNYTFSGSTYTYDGVSVPNAVESVTITPTGSASTTVNSVEVLSDEASDPILLTAGSEETITVTVSESGKTSRTYTIKITRNLPAIDTPTFSPVAGAITFGTTVTISSSGADAIYYTTDGSTPTTSSTNQATTPLVINSGVTVKALAVKATYDDSAIASATYTQAATADLTNLVISNSPSNYTFAGGTYTYNSVTVASGVSSITVTPTGAGTITVDGVTVASGQASEAISLTSGVEKSIVVVATETGKSAKTYTINVTRVVAVPTGLSANAVSTTQINLAWTNTDTEANTRIYRDDALITTVDPGVSTYNNASLTEGTEYDYTVRHYRGGVESANSNTSTATTHLTVEYLVVGGGGGGSGADFASGGGGGGGVLTGTTEIETGSISVTVGDGGVGGTVGSGYLGSNGGSSSLGSIAVASGGGRGGNGGTPGTAGASGGSGGGGGGSRSGNTPRGAAGSGIAGQGYAGGAGGYTETTNSLGGGGGGGAGGVGSNGPDGTGVGANGGPGIASSISGTSLSYGGGGGGAGIFGGGTGGSGVGGNGGHGGGTEAAAATAGMTNRGGGGGAGGTAYTYAGTGAPGGSGIVIIRYLGAQKATGGSISSSGGYTIHTFTSGGTFTFN